MAPPSGRPLPLVTTGADGRFSLGEEALAVLRSCTGPVAVAAVCGRARQGKSYILNQIAKHAASSGGAAAGAPSGFLVASTVKPCTKGVWLWSAPIPRVAPDGTAYKLILLDTEGIDAYDQTGQYSTQIFALAVLLSSLFVYNQLGAIDEAALDRLALVSEVSRSLAGKAAGAKPAAGAEADVARFAPSFLWLLRDFYLDLSEDGRVITPREYLEAALRLAPGAGAAVESKNQIRRSIASLFPNRDCFTLVRPVNDEKQLQQLDALPRSALRPEFAAGVDSLTAAILATAGPKRLGGDVLTGGALARLAQSYVAALNAGAVPAIASAWEAVAAAECAAATAAGAAAYDASWDAAKAAPEEAALADSHSKALGAARAAFAQQAVGPPALRAAHEAQMTASLQRRFGDARGRVLAEAAAACGALLARESDAVAAVARAPGATVAAVAAAADAAAARYEAAARGPGRGDALAAWLRGVMRGALLDAAARQMEAASRDTADARRDAQQAQVTARDATARADRAEAGLAAAQAATRDAAARADAARDAVTQQAGRAGEAAAAAAAAQAEAAALRQRCAAAEGGREASAAQAAAAAADATAARAEAARLRAAVAAAEAEAQRARAAASAAEGDSASHKAAAAAAAGETARVRASAEAALKAERDAAAAASAASTARLAAMREEAAAAAGAASAQRAAAQLQLPQPDSPKRPRRAATPPPAPAFDEDAGAAGGGDDDVDPASLSVNELKAALTAAGHEAACFDLAAKKGKKADFVALYRKLMR